MNLFECVVCGASTIHGDHHCDKKKLDRVEGGRKGAGLAADDGRQPPLPYGVRLERGFTMLELMG